MWIADEIAQQPKLPEGSEELLGVITSTFEINAVEFLSFSASNCK